MITLLFILGIVFVIAGAIWHRGLMAAGAILLLVALVLVLLPQLDATT